jgi:hypothetical protein
MDIPGMKAVHAIITPVCRSNRGDDGALEEAFRRVRAEYEACSQLDCNLTVNYHLVLTVERHGHH